MGKRKIVGRCRLCHSEECLVDSHIIPNFHFKRMKGTENRYFVLSTNSAKKELQRQKGITEPLLCHKCDNERLSKYEAHVRQVIFGGIRLETRENGRLLIFKGYDYKKLKNGLLSILWRMSV